MVDLPIRPHIRVTPVGMLNIPMEISPVGARVVRDPLIIIYILVATPQTSGRIFQPIARFWRNEGMPSTARQKSPRVF